MKSKVKVHKITVIKNEFETKYFMGSTEVDMDYLDMLQEFGYQLKFSDKTNKVRSKNNIIQVDFINKKAV